MSLRRRGKRSILIGEEKKRDPRNLPPKRSQGKKMRIFWIRISYYIFLGVSLYLLFYFLSNVSEPIYYMMNDGESISSQETGPKSILAAVFIFVIIVLSFLYVYVLSDGRISYVVYFIAGWISYYAIGLFFIVLLNGKDEGEDYPLFGLILSIPMAIGSASNMLRDYNDRHLYSMLDVPNKEKTNVHTQRIFIISFIIAVSIALIEIFYQWTLHGIGLRVAISSLLFFSLETMEIANGNKKGLLWMFVTCSYLFFLQIEIAFVFFMLEISFIYFDLVVLRKFSMNIYESMYMKEKRQEEKQRPLNNIPVVYQRDGTNNTMSRESTTGQREYIPNEDIQQAETWRRERGSQSDRKKQKRSQRIEERESPLSSIVLGLLTQEDRQSEIEKTGGN